MKVIHIQISIWKKSALMICISKKLRLIDSTEIQTVRLIGTVRLIETAR